jgi:hypothetical protein
MQIKHEYTDANNTKTFQQVFDGYVQGFENFFYLNDHITTLGEVRGRSWSSGASAWTAIRMSEVLWPSPSWPDNMTFGAIDGKRDGLSDARRYA